MELQLPSSVIASGKERDEQEGPPGVFRCGSDAMRMICMLTEACTPNMSKRSGRRRGGIVKRRVCVSAEAIILLIPFRSSSRSSGHFGFALAK